jgi:group I intron endonuclease
VGKGKGKRAFSTSGRNKYWKNIVNKVGYTPMIIENFLTEEESFELEKYYIQHFDRNNLCNMTDGGEGISGVIRTEETRKKIGESRKGEKHFMYGKKHTEETKKKMSEVRKGIKFSEETKKKMSEKGKKRIGEKNPFYGRKLTDESKKKISESRKGKKIYDENPRAKKVINTLTGEIYGCGKEVAEILNINYGTLRAQLNGRNQNKTPFKYYE